MEKRKQTNKLTGTLLPAHEKLCIVRLSGHLTHTPLCVLNTVLSYEYVMDKMYTNVSLRIKTQLGKHINNSATWISISISISLLENSSLGIAMRLSLSSSLSLVVAYIYTENTCNCGKQCFGVNFTVIYAWRHTLYFIAKTFYSWLLLNCVTEQPPNTLTHNLLPFSKNTINIKRIRSALIMRVCAHARARYTFTHRERYTHTHTPRTTYRALVLAMKCNIHFYTWQDGSIVIQMDRRIQVN